MCLPIYRHINFAQDIICSSPQNKLYLGVMKEMSRYRMSSNSGKPTKRIAGWASTVSLFSMGPPIYNRVIFSMVFGREISGRGNIPGMENDMKVLQKEASDIIATAQYQDHCNSFIAEPFDGCIESDRRELYVPYGMMRWSIAVKLRWGEL